MLSSRRRQWWVVAVILLVGPLSWFATGRPLDTYNALLFVKQLKVGGTTLAGVVRQTFMHR
jgi:hypothetical protein